MNKILNINLGGYAFTIDDDAYEYLSAYLDSIRARFSASEGRDEILSDIETRLGELITAELGNRNIVMLPDVEAAIQIMGKPEDFGADPIDNRRNMHSGSKNRGQFRTGRRLMRDEDDKVAGGVCSGLAAYFGIHDAVWVRLAFVLLTFISIGFWIATYIILWAVLPPARTAADRLAMRGEPINVDNIAREVEDGFERISEQVNRMSSQAKKKSGIDGRKMNNGLANLLNIIGSLFAFAVRMIAKFGVLILAIVAFAMVISLIVGWVGSFWGIVAAAPYIEFFSPFSSGTTYLAATALFFLLAIPAVGLALLLGKVLFKLNIPRWLGAAMGAVWTLSLISAVVLGAFTAQSFRQSRTYSQSVDLSGLRSDTLRVAWAPDIDFSGADGPFNSDGLHIVDKNLIIRFEPDIRVRQSNKGRFECTRSVTALGESDDQALENAAKAGFSPVLEGNILKVPKTVAIPPGIKFRTQNTKLNIFVPVGKYIVFEPEINDHTWDSDYADDDDENRISNRPNQVFVMTEKGLRCVDCPGFGEQGYETGDTYENFILEGDFNTEIRKADRFNLVIQGNANEIEHIRSGNKLTLSAKNPASKSVKVIIETPVFTELYANNTGDVVIRGFDEGQASITALGKSKIKGYFDSNQLNLNLSGPCSLELFGRGNSLDITLSETAELNAGGYRCEIADVNASGSAKAKLMVNELATIKNDGSASINVEGGARIETQPEQ